MAAMRKTENQRTRKIITVFQVMKTSYGPETMLADASKGGKAVKMGGWCREEFLNAFTIAILAYIC